MAMLNQLDLKIRVPDGFTVNNTGSLVTNLHKMLRESKHEKNQLSWESFLCRNQINVTMLLDAIIIIILIKFNFLKILAFFLFPNNNCVHYFFLLWRSQLMSTCDIDIVKVKRLINDYYNCQ